MIKKVRNQPYAPKVGAKRKKKEIDDHINWLETFLKNTDRDKILYKLISFTAESVIIRCWYTILCTSEA
jgi:hypothetical protein